MKNKNTNKNWLTIKNLQKTNKRNIPLSLRNYQSLRYQNLMGPFLISTDFLGMFEAQVDKANSAPVTKFAYLKELVDTKVRSLIDGLPFNSEGYERAKQILKSKYGKPSEISNAHMQGIISLPVIHGSQPTKINEFYEKLLTHVQALETMGKLSEVNGYVRLTLDKVPGIRADLVRLDDDWHEWKFFHLLEALKKWCERNPTPSTELANFSQYKPQGAGPGKSPRKERAFNAREETIRLKTCVYCKSEKHKSVDCEQVKDIAGRRKILSESKLCFNCTGPKHRASQCQCKTNCQNCNGRHHTSFVIRQLILIKGK